MAPNDGSEQPLIPRRWDTLYDSEQDSDVVFLVGDGEERFPGHRDILSRANPVFQMMLKGSLSSPDPIRIVDVDARAFDLLLRYLYKEEVRIQSVTTALLTLQAAHKYICVELIDACITYLDAHMTVDSVLEIYAYILQFTRAPSLAPSAPPLYHSPVHRPPHASQPLNLPSPSPVQPNVSCEDLLHNVLQFIDNNANEILVQEHIEDLDLEGLQLILCRDTLRVSSEHVVYCVLNRWSHRECKRKQLALTDENKRMVLGEETIFLIRFLLMDESQFVSGPMNGGLLDPVDTTFIYSQITNRAIGGVGGKKFEDLLPIWRSERSKPDTGVKVLSCRTSGTTWRGSDVGAASGKAKSAKSCKKSQKKEKKRSMSLSPEREKRGSKVLECFVGVVSCIFD